MNDNTRFPLLCYFNDRDNNHLALVFVVDFVGTIMNNKHNGWYIGYRLQANTIIRSMFSSEKIIPIRESFKN